jgi:hypothetical protein
MSGPIQIAPRLTFLLAIEAWLWQLAFSHGGPTERLPYAFRVGRSPCSGHPKLTPQARTAAAYASAGRSQAQPEQALLAKGAPPQPSPLLEEGGRAYQPGAPKGPLPRPAMDSRPARTSQHSGVGTMSTACGRARLSAASTDAAVPPNVGT